MPRPVSPPLLIAGPTASGKSAYALARASEEPSLIVNADSMQVYADLRVLTARPSAEDEARHAHALYGMVPARVAYSTGQYLQDVATVLDAASADRRRVIVVGGTGLYFKALLEGLSPVPPVDPDIRAYWRAEAIRLGPAELHRILTARDPLAAARLRPSDPQRVTRALEVLDATGRSLAEWQQQAGTPLIDADACERVVILPDRAALLARADSRFDAMMASGALDEVARLAALQLDPALPVMRALGVPQLMAHLREEIDLVRAVALAKLATRQYIKRQTTWIKNQMISWKHLNT